MDHMDIKVELPIRRVKTPAEVRREERENSKSLKLIPRSQLEGKKQLNLGGSPKHSVAQVALSMIGPWQDPEPMTMKLPAVEE